MLATLSWHGGCSLLACSISPLPSLPPPSIIDSSPTFSCRAPCCRSHFWILLSICWASLLFAAITSGLALGLLSFSQVDLEVFIKAGQPKIQKNAAKIMSIVKNEHLLLCTLLLAKSMALEGKVESCHFMKLIIAGALDLTQKTAKDALKLLTLNLVLDVIVNVTLGLTTAMRSQKML
ncbi:DUF21 domain-containing protein [Glycine max]|nr:DUF21 domain-containing protein [Glycine max]